VTQRRKSRLVFRVYALTAGLAVAIMIALLVLPRYTRGARYLEPQAALVQFLVDRWSLKNPKEFDESLRRIEPRLRGKLTIYAHDGRMLRTQGEVLDAPSEAEQDQLVAGKWALSYGRIVVRSDDATMVGVYEPNRPGFPWDFVLPLGAGVLAVVGAASIWFARRLARPLDALAVAARKFGSGDMAARANLRSDDEIGEVGQAFDAMAERTAIVLKQQRQLMADVSHELRTPLARIRVALELVVEDPVAASDVLADVSGDLDEIDQLIGDILTTARLDVGTELRTEPHPVAELAAAAAQRFAKQHPRRVLECDGPRRLDDGGGGEVEIDCDAVLLRRALDNLLDNAVKYSDAAHPVQLAVTPNGTMVAFEVVDRGVGMSADELENAFTPFWRADSSRARKTGGVGLGLALARRIARAHGGDVTLRSSPGKGTTARLEVPLGAATNRNGAATSRS